MKKCVKIKVMILKCKELIHNKPNIKVAIGLIFIVIGLIALVTPLTPGAWLMIVGLELLGVRLVIFDRITQWRKNYF